MNILLTSVGRRNYIVEYFKNELKEKGRVIVTNSIADTSGMYLGDKSYRTPPIKSSEYIPFLLDICEKEKITAVIPLFDMDVSAISINKDLFLKHKIFPVVSRYPMISICFDKLEYPSFLEGIGLKTPRIFSSLENVKQEICIGNAAFPFIIKPRWGTGSILTEVVHDEKELDYQYALLSLKIKSTFLDDPVPEGHLNTIIIQQHIKGEEFGMDVVNDLNGNYVKTYVKRKLGMRSGETDGAVTIRNQEYESIGKRISIAFEHLSILDIDFIVNDNSEVYIIDMNPRFGGGYPFTHQAGVNLPAMIVSWLRGESPNEKFCEMADGVLSVKGISLFSKQM